MNHYETSDLCIFVRIGILYKKMSLDKFTSTISKIIPKTVQKAPKKLRLINKIHTPNFSVEREEYSGLAFS